MENIQREQKGRSRSIVLLWESSLQMIRFFASVSFLVLAEKLTVTE